LDIREIVLLAFAILVGFTVHEAAHGYAAYRLGDRTAFYRGRLTLNPLRHVDPLGTVFLPAALLLAHSPFIFGYAKPVPVQPANFVDPRRDMALVAAAGPASNLVLAALFWSIARLIPMTPGDWLSDTLRVLTTTNVLLAAFNILPIPPLDGANVAAGFLPEWIAKPYLRLGRIPFLPFILIFFGVPALAWLFAQLQRWF
jgi:Zn-dependent protease